MTNETIKQMRQRHEAEITELQANCEHSIWSDWMSYMWAPGHYAGEVKTCMHCGKIMANSLKEVCSNEQA
jgi:hypothetical protein